MSMRSWAASGRIRWAIGGVLVLVSVLLLLLAVFPWGVFRSTIEQRASAELGRPVTIGSVERADLFSFTPTVLIRDVRIPQARWAQGGPLARIDTARVKFSTWSLLLGKFHPLALEAHGLRMVLVRDANGRENWRSDTPRKSGGGGSTGLEALTLSDAIVEYRDAKAGRAFTVRLDSDVRSGLRIAGTGVIGGNSVTLTASGPSVAQGQGKPWPFQALIDGPAIRFAASGTMDRPLDTAHMTVDIKARAQDLKLIDAIIEAGLIGTQPVNLKAHARHDGPDWTVTRVAGTIGRSDIAGNVTVRKRSGRTRLDGAIVSNALLFDDFASDAGLAKAAALERAQGPRLVPNLRINIRKIDDTDGAIDFTVRRLIDGKRPSAFTAMRGRLAIDHQLMTIDPLRVELKKGAITGSLRVDQRGGVPVPQVTIDLKLADSSIAALAGGGAVSGRVDGRVHLVGRGSTIREAVGNGDGRIGVIARDGSLPRKFATMMGFDVGGTLTAGEGERSDLRCIALRLDMRRGTGTADPLVIDTSRSQARGTGTIRFPDEAIALTFTGAPKSGGLIRLSGAAVAGGTIRNPDLMIPEPSKSLGSILKGIGRAIDGGQRLADDADCGALAARALE